MTGRDWRMIAIGATGVLVLLSGMRSLGVATGLRARGGNDSDVVRAEPPVRLGTSSSVVMPAVWMVRTGGETSGADDDAMESMSPAGGPSSGTGSSAATSSTGEAATDSPLSGPKVQERTAEAAAATLIVRDFNGRIERLEVDPAIAALEHLTLDAAAMEKINTIIAERNAIIDRVVQENVLQLQDVGQAFQGGDKQKGMEALRSLMQAVKPLRDRGRLIEEIAPLMPEDQRAEARRLVNEYWQAIVRERMEIGPPGEPGKKMTYMEASATEMLLSLGREAKGGFERTIGQQADRFEELLKKLNLTPEQESKIRAAVQDSVGERLKPDADGKTRGYSVDREPTGRQKLRNAGRFMEIYGMLDADQRRILLQEMRTMRAYEPMGK